MTKVPNIAGPFSDDQVAHLSAELKQHLPEKEQSDVVITQLTDGRAKKSLPQVKASDECTLGTYRLIERIMQDIGLTTAQSYLENPVFEIPSISTFGGIQPSALKLTFPQFVHASIESRVVDLSGDPQPYAAIYCGKGQKAFNDFLEIASLINTDSEIEVYWPPGQTHHLTFHQQNTLEDWLSKNC